MKKIMIRFMSFFLSTFFLGTFLLGTCIVMAAPHDHKSEDPKAKPAHHKPEHHKPGHHKPEHDKPEHDKPRHHKPEHHKHKSPKAPPHENHMKNHQPPTESDVFKPAYDKMHKDMMIAPTGNVDVDFVKGMIPHHQGAIDMARIELEHGKDPALRALSERIIAAQEIEIKEMQEWLDKHDPKNKK